MKEQIMKRYYNTCPNCNANLDPGEICNCEMERIERENKIIRQLIIRPGEQIAFKFEFEI